MQYQIMKEGMPIAEFAEEVDAKKFLEEKQEGYVRDMYRERLHAYMEEHGRRYPGDVKMAEADGILKRLRDESKKIFQLNDSSADKDVYAGRLAEKITPIFKNAKAVMDEDMAELEGGSTYYELEDSFLDLYSDINSFLAGGSEAKTLLNGCFTSNGDSKLEDMLISIRKMGLAADTEVYPVLDSVRDLKRDYQGIKIVNSITGNQEKSFAQQVDEVLNGTYNRYNNDLKVGDTPQILLDVGCKQLPIFYTQKHLKDAIKPKGYKGGASHQHGLSVDQVKDISNLLADPVMIYDSLSKNNSIVVVTSELDQDKCPIIAVLQPNGNARYNLEVVPSNFLLSVYGKDNLEWQLKNALKDDKILYINKNKSQMLFSVRGLSLSTGFNNIDFDTIIHKSRNIVNGFEKNNYENNQKKQIKEIEKITKELEQGITELFNSERYKEYLQVMSKFHNYSVNNTLLIAMQKPDASLIAGYNTWKNKFGRNVMKGEKGIRILAPAPYKIQQQVEKKDPKTGKTVIGMDGQPVMETREVQIPAFKMVSVFDVSQTEGRELPAPAVSELTGGVEQYEDFYAALERTSPVPMSFEKIEGRSHGYYHLEEKRIAIAEGMSGLQNLKTAIHEIAHAKLHDIDLDAPQEEQTDRPDRSTREVQAESIAYTVCRHYGLDTSDYSFGYIAGWSSGRELAELKSSLETIRAAAAEIIGGIDGHFAELQKQRETEKEREVEKSFSEQVDDVLAGNATYYNNLKLCDTPQILLDVGCEQLPMLYTQRHLKDALHKKSEKNSHWHGLTVEQIKSVPNLLANPAMIFDSISANKEAQKSIIAVLNATDNDNAPLIVSIKPNGSGVYELEKVDSNFITSIYGKDSNFENFIERAAISDNMLYWNKNESQELFSCLGLQLPKAINNLDFNTIIRKSRNIINSFEKNNYESNQIHAKEPEATAHAQTQTEHCKDMGSWAARIENRKNVASEKGFNAAVREQKPDIHKGNFGR